MLPRSRRMIYVNTSLGSLRPRGCDVKAIIAQLTGYSWLLAALRWQLKPTAEIPILLMLK